MTIKIEKLTFDTIIGILEHERHTPQRVLIDLVIDYEFDEKSSDFINYAEVASFIEEVMQKEQFELLETALLRLTTLIKKNFPLSQKILLTISKPDIIDNCSVSLTMEKSFL